MCLGTSGSDSMLRDVINDSHLVVECLKQNQTQDFERQEDCVLEDNHQEDVMVGNAVLPVLQCLDFIPHTVLDLVDSYYRLVMRVFALQNHEVQQLYG